MPEYLSPGVYIEEVPARLKAIEGVSTSTAGFVGNCERGPVAGFNPFAGPPNPPRPDFRAALDPTPVLVTSFADCARLFGQPPADLSRRTYLTHAARSFFNNGGRRLYVARVTGAGAAAAAVRLNTGALLRLTRAPRAGDTELFLNSLRGVGESAGALTFRSVADDSQVLQVEVSDCDEQAGSVTIPAPLSAADAASLDPARVYAEVAGVAVAADAGPRVVARNPGAWGNQVRVGVECSDRPAVAVAATSGTDLVQVAQTSSFYRGAVVSVTTTAGHVARVVLDILPNNVLRLSADTAVTTDTRVRVLEIDVTTADLATGQVETFRGLTWNAANDPDLRRRHYSTVINARSRLVYVQPPWAGLEAGPAFAEDNPTLANMPMTPRAGLAALAGGADETATPTDAQVVGVDLGPGNRGGIHSLQDVDDVRIIAAPGYTGATVQGALIAQCERLRYRFAVLDGEPEPAGASVVNSVLTHRNAYDTSFAAYYTPWVEAGEGDQRLLLPPSGHVAGIYARTDTERGVHKAPANEVVRGITGLRAYLTTGEQDVLNPRGVNAIRRFEGRGVRVWGARTLSSDPELRYVNVRRFLIFLEASIDRGTQHVVFEPNSPETWGRVVDSVSAFLHTQWRAGALFGRRPEDAFFVRCDETTMTADDVQNGRLICTVGVAIVRPVEFVIFRIEQISGFARQT
jgi:phage tail sheath protein FI